MPVSLCNVHCDIVYLIIGTVYTKKKLNVFVLRFFNIVTIGNKNINIDIIANPFLKKDTKLKLNIMGTVVLG